jgi:putative FmdB family regulatory protein
MPTYSYRCTACDQAFDIQQAFSDESLTVCPACEGELRKVFNTIGVTFQGSGFYRTDSRAEAQGKSGGKSASLPAKESAKKETPKKETPSKASTPTSS